jgi:CRISPR-associated protein Csd1
VLRYFAAASSAPASVFPLLLKSIQPYLADLSRDSRPAKKRLVPFFQRRIEDIMVEMGGEFPPSLSVRNQGAFAVAYYEQRAAIRAYKKSAGAKAKEDDKVEQEV